MKHPNPNPSDIGAKLVGLMVGCVVYGIGVVFIGACGFVGEIEAGLGGAFLLWTSSLVIIGTLTSLPGHPTSVTRLGSLASLVTRFATIRDWTTVGSAAVKFAFASPFGMLAAVIIVDITNWRGDAGDALFASFIVLFLGTVASVIVIPPAMLGLAMTPAIDPDNQGNRYASLVIGAGVFYGASWLVALNFIDGPGIRSGAAEWLGIVAMSTLVPAGFLFFTIRIALVVGLLRRG